eukprot:745575-Rhodomonas_salina.1
MAEEEAEKERRAKLGPVARVLAAVRGGWSALWRLSALLLVTVAGLAVIVPPFVVCYCAAAVVMAFSPFRGQHKVRGCGVGVWRCREGVGKGLLCVGFEGVGCGMEDGGCWESMVIRCPSEDCTGRRRTAKPRAANAVHDVTRCCPGLCRCNKTICVATVQQPTVATQIVSTVVCWLM